MWYIYQINNLPHAWKPLWNPMFQQRLQRIPRVSIPFHCSLLKMAVRKPQGRTAFSVKMLAYRVCRALVGFVYTKRQLQRCHNSAMMAMILFSLKTMEWLQNGIAIHFQATPLLSMRTEMQASMQSCCRVDADAWCERALSASQSADRVRLPCHIILPRSVFQESQSCLQPLVGMA